METRCIMIKPKNLGAFAGFLFAAAMIGDWAPAPVVAQGAATTAPSFQVDSSWPQLPNNWVMGNVSSVAVDRHDHIWLLPRPGVGVPEDRKDRGAPPVREFDPAGQ